MEQERETKYQALLERVRRLHAEGFELPDVDMPYSVLDRVIAGLDMPKGIRSAQLDPSCSFSIFKLYARRMKILDQDTYVFWFDGR